MISDFPNPPSANLPGLLSYFEFIPSHYIQSLPALNGVVINTPLTLRGATRFLYGLSVQGKLNFNEESAVDENGTIYNWKITGFYPGDEPAITAMFAAMEGDHIRHVLIVADPSGRLRLVGYKAPLIFTAVYDSGLQAGDARGYTFSFTGKGRVRAPYYQV